jgi:hypothetical protein
MPRMTKKQYDQAVEAIKQGPERASARAGAAVAKGTALSPEQANILSVLGASVAVMQHRRGMSEEWNPTEKEITEFLEGWIVFTAVG